MARIRAALRRWAGTDPYRVERSEPYVLGDLTIDYAARRVTIAGQPVELTTTEYEMLSELSVNAGRVLTHDQLLRRVWGTYVGDVRVIRTLVRQLRGKLGDDARNPTYIFAERRVG
ncbi:MAG: response regulator transcription factor [Gemmatimonadota bacterium]|nr:response regulator transcription factor [Gemmatimonadota bacterium]